MDNTTTTTNEMLAANKTIFNRFTNSTELAIFCLKVVLSVKKKQRTLSAGHTTSVADHQQPVPHLAHSETQLMNDCVIYLKNFNQVILRKLIQTYYNTNSSSSGSSSTNSLQNLNGTSTVQQEFPIANDWYVVSIWSVLFVSMVLFAIFGNSLIIWIILRQKIMRTVINIFLLNLTLSDLITVTFNATFNFVYMLTENWPFIHSYCLLNNFISNLTVASSVFTATVMSIDRYIAIVHPLKPRMTRRRALINITLIWLCSAFFASPTIMYSKIITIPYSKQNVRTLCLLEWPDGTSPVSSYDLAYNIAFLLLTYILPMLTMAIAYTLMARVLWDSRHNSLNSNIQTELIRSKQKCVRMLIAVISVFGICWLPYHSYFLSTYIWPNIIKTKGIKHIYLAIYWLAMANSLFNPIILFVMNKRFRHCITYYIRCRCFTGRAIDLDPRVSVMSTRLSTPRVSSKKRNNYKKTNNNNQTNGNKRNNSFQCIHEPEEAEVSL